MLHRENMYDLEGTNFALISIANQRFGRGHWSHGVTSQTLDYTDYIRGKFHAGCASVVRVQKKDGEFHEGMGYHTADSSTKGSVIQKVRLGSLNDGFKKALKCFDIEISNKICKSADHPMSPLPEINSVEIHRAPPLEPDIIFETSGDSFNGSIPVSQADALMDMAEMDQMFEKDQQSSEFQQSPIQIKKDPLDEVENNPFDEVKKDPLDKIEKNGCHPKTSADKAPASNGVKKEVPRESSKSIESKGGKEDEMRLERKRKQREMQEDFKRKMEMKKMHTDNGNSEPNPRY